MGEDMTDQALEQVEALYGTCINCNPIMKTGDIPEHRTPVSVTLVHRDSNCLDCGLYRPEYPDTQITIFVPTRTRRRTATQAHDDIGHDNEKQTDEYVSEHV